jgi:hypothetical protein
MVLVAAAHVGRDAAGGPETGTAGGGRAAPAERDLTGEVRVARHDIIVASH